MQVKPSRRTFVGGLVAAISATACALPVKQPLNPGATPTSLAGPATPTTGSTPIPAATRVATTPIATTPVATTAVDGYVVVAPSTLGANNREEIAVSLLTGNRPTAGAVTLELRQNTSIVAQATGTINGHGTLPLDVPNLPDGSYTLAVRGDTFQDSASVAVQLRIVVVLETDKPIYQPGQTIQARALRLDAGLRPAAAPLDLTVTDAKGIKVFRDHQAPDGFGLVAFNLPLSSEPNLGVWTIEATDGAHSASLSVQVDTYVLPKYSVAINLEKPWALVNDTVRGTIKATYTYGKAVRGEVDLVASRYVGTWQEYARQTKALDGSIDFELPAVGYAAGTPQNGGAAEIHIAATVREEVTLYEETENATVTIVASPVLLKVIPEGTAFKPTLPFSAIVVAETPDHQPVDTQLTATLTYRGLNGAVVRTETPSAATQNGLVILTSTPPATATELTLDITDGQSAQASATVNARYSPSSSFVHIAPVAGQTNPKVGETLRLHVLTTAPATTLYYDVLARGQLVLTGIANGNDIELPIMPEFAPEAKIVVYQILPNAEVTSDYVAVTIAPVYPQTVGLTTPTSPLRPGDSLDVQFKSDPGARIAVRGTDHAVAILAENRLNLDQVFAELEKLFLKPQAQVLPGVGPGVGAAVAPGIGPAAGIQFGGGSTTLPGAKDTFADAGTVVMTNRQVPNGKTLNSPNALARGGVPGIAVAQGAAAPVAANAAAPAAPAPAAAASAADAASTVAPEAPRVRQFFPETWIWTILDSDAQGVASLKATAPDSITTWDVHALAISKDGGLGVADGSVTVFQPFFIQADLPYSVTRGEEFPLRLSVYNYLATSQSVSLEVAAGDWFDALDPLSATVDLPANGVGALVVRIRPTGLGVKDVNVTGRGGTVADALIKTLIVEPEGAKREAVDNIVLDAGKSKTFDLSFPADAVAGSQHAVVTVSGSLLGQSLNGIGDLLGMPYGCGEQNMILFAPDVAVANYWKQTGQTVPDQMAKAELLMLTGYQRELTYRRSDGSFSAFGQSDPDGSLWLTAFVLRTFAQARGLIGIDDTILASASAWLTSHQNSDGSFDAVGFLHHQDLLGGLRGQVALTAYTTLALLAVGERVASSRAVQFLESAVDALQDSYTTALVTFALAVAKSSRAAAAQQRLLALARPVDGGLEWGDEPVVVPLPATNVANGANGAPVADVGQIINPIRPPTAVVETTAYAALALLELNDLIHARQALRALVLRRNGSGGFGSTQDSVVALQALAAAATKERANADATVSLSSGSWSKTAAVNAANADVTQEFDLPAGASLDVGVAGKGTIVVQVARRYNMSVGVPAPTDAFKIGVVYGSTHLQTDDILDITATVTFTPPVLPIPVPLTEATPVTGDQTPPIGVLPPVRAGMVVADIAVPTGFALVPNTMDAAASQDKRIKRWDQAERKVIVYITDLGPGETLIFHFGAKAQYPVRAQPVVSQVYSYYRPDWRAEDPGQAVVVGAVV